MPFYPLTSAFRSASVILPLIDETISLSTTVDMILAKAPADVREFLIVVCERTKPESMAVAAALPIKLPRVADRLGRSQMRDSLFSQKDLHRGA